MPNPNHYFENSVFWIEVEKIKPNPYQPRREFDEARLKDLADSIRMYGILQPLVVTRREYTKDDGGLAVEYELISGERRLRASKIAGLAAVPALIRNGEDDSKLKLELAIIENLQREDINAVDRARAFDKLAKEFGMKHAQIAEKVGKSREYVSNTLRILALPDVILDAISEGKISEGHTRPLLMLVDRPEEQVTLFKDITLNKMSVREAESVARKVAVDRSRKRDWSQTPEIMEMERKFKEVLGTRVAINRSETGGRITIDFFTPEDIRTIFEKITHEATNVNIPVAGRLATTPTGLADAAASSEALAAAMISGATPLEILPEEKPMDDRGKADEVKEENEEIYSIKNFGV